RRYRRFAEPMNGGASETRHALGETVQVKPEGRERDAGLDKLTARIAQLDAHIAKLECNAAIEGARQTEAVKALQARIAGLAAQFARTAARSTAQGTELAKAVEAVAGKVSQSRNRADEQHKASNERFSSFAENVASISEKLEESRTENAGHVRQVEERVTVMEVTVETVARDGEAAVRLNGSIDSLTQRFDASEAEYLNNVERFENRLTRIESESGDTFIDRRLQSIEQALADMTKLIEKNAREEAGASETIEKPAAVAQAE